MKKCVIVVSAVMLLFNVSCDTQPKTDLTNNAFIPKPVSATASGEIFQFNENTTIYFDEDAEDLKQTGEYLSAKIKELSGYSLELKTTDELPRRGIYLTLVDDEMELGKESYDLNIGSEIISIQAESSAGAFYAVQTLLQAVALNTASDKLQLATGTIHDFPEFEYRGAMLDVARHFFSVEDVKRFIGFLAAFKMNHLHLHLSDDQGWRIEIKSRPKLTEIAGSTEVGGGEGGFYTQEEYSEIVDYANQHHINIVPEIDMPGHTNAALASYPELNCDGKATELYTGTEVGFSTLCARKEVTYEFIDDVVREISALTPGPYFHIGGDESHVTEHDDYVYFVNRAQDIVTSHGKKVIGWDEIANAELVDNAIVQFWANIENTKMGVNQGAKVIMSPAKKAYLDMKYDSTTHLGLNWAGYIEIDSAYIWNPTTYVDGVTKENIIGIEAPLWSETVTNINEVEYMVFPRLAGYAEIGWTAPEARDWDDYKARLAKYGKRFEAMDIDFYRSKQVPWQE